METLETLPILRRARRSFPPSSGSRRGSTRWSIGAATTRARATSSDSGSGTLGPTATWLVRRLAAGFDDQPDGYDLDLATTAQALGLSYSKGASSAFAKAFGRCIMFGLAHQRSDGYAVRRLLPDVARRHLSRMPHVVQQEHERWLEAARGHRLEVLQRARSLAVAMLDAGDDAELIEPQLVAVGIPDDHRSRGGRAAACRERSTPDRRRTQATAGRWPSTRRRRGRRRAGPGRRAR